MATLTCDRARDQFSEALEHRLTPQLAVTFDLHLESCLRCQRDFTALQTAVAALHACEIERVPESFFPSLDARLEAIASRPAHRVAGLVAAAAALTLVCFGWPWLQRTTRVATLAALTSPSAPETTLEPAPMPAPVVRTEPEPIASAQTAEAADALVEPDATHGAAAARTAEPVASTETAPAIARPMLNIDTQPLADLLAAVWMSWRTPVRPASPVIAAAPSPEAESVLAIPIAVGPEPLVATVTSSDENSAPVVVERGEGYVQIKTSGSPDEVIPALLALVAERDPELRSAAEEHLRLMHESFMENPELSAQLTPLRELPRSRSLAALHDPDATANASRQRWEQWWKDNRQLVDR